MLKNHATVQLDLELGRLLTIPRKIIYNLYNLLLTANKIVKHIPILKTVRGVLFLFSFANKKEKELSNLTVANQKNYKKNDMLIYLFKINDTMRPKRNAKFFVDSVKKGFGPVAKNGLILTSITTVFSSMHNFLTDYYNKLFNVNVPVKSIIKPGIGFIITKNLLIQKKHSAEMLKSSSSENVLWAKPKFMISTENFDLKTRKKRVAPLIIAGAIYSGKVIIWSISMGAAGVATGVALAYYQEQQERKNMKERMAAACQIYNSGCLSGFCWSNCGPRFMVCRNVLFHNFYILINFYLFLIITAG